MELNLVLPLAIYIHIVRFTYYFKIISNVKGTQSQELNKALTKDHLSMNILNNIHCITQIHTKMYYNT